MLMSKFREETRKEEESVGEFGLYYQERRSTVEDEDNYRHPDIRHTAPQHR